MAAQSNVAEGALAAFRDSSAATRVVLPQVSDLPRAQTVYLKATQVRERYGGISDMTLWRWLRDKELGFPKPRVINRMRYWNDSELTEWEHARRSTCHLRSQHNEQR
jgi:predicted DNA-binding transcriptional regulator AlpA